MPSTENLWENDSLNREEEGKFLLDYLLKYYAKNKNSSFVLNINAEWGYGKTYFLTNLSKEFENKEHPVVYFDAWKNDYTDQPLLAFMSVLEEKLMPFFSTSLEAKKKFKASLREYKNLLIPILVKKLTGMGVEELLEHYEEQSDVNPEIEEEGNALSEEVSTVLTKFVNRALQEHNEVKNSIDQFKVKMKDLLEHIDTQMPSKLPMFIFIDELDRCRPNYAIELLENIKHIFDIPGVIFIIATDSKQLANSINAVYGEKFASERYLKRFFDQEYAFINPDSYKFAHYLFTKHGLLDNRKLFSPLKEVLYPQKNINVQLFAYYADYFQLGLRDQEQAILVLVSIEVMWEGDHDIHLGYLLFLIMLRQKSNEQFLNFKNAEDNRKAMIVDKELKDVNNQIVYDSRSFGDGHRPSVTQPMIDYIIKGYCKILSVTPRTRNDFNYVEDDEVIENLNSRILIKLPHKLDSYPNLVLRAGQLS